MGYRNYHKWTADAAGGYTAVAGARCRARCSALLALLLGVACVAWRSVPSSSGPRTDMICYRCNHTASGYPDARLAWNRPAQRGAYPSRGPMRLSRGSKQLEAWSTRKSVRTQTLSGHKYIYADERRPNRLLDATQKRPAVPIGTSGATRIGKAHRVASEGPCPALP